MNLTTLILWSTSIIIGLAGVHHIDDIHLEVLKAQAKLIHASRTETWGSPKFLSSESSLEGDTQKSIQEKN